MRLLRPLPEICVNERKDEKRKRMNERRDEREDG